MSERSYHGAGHRATRQTSVSRLHTTMELTVTPVVAKLSVILIWSFVGFLFLILIYNNVYIYIYVCVCVCVCVCVRACVCVCVMLKNTPNTSIDLFSLYLCCYSLLLLLLLLHYHYHHHLLLLPCHYNCIYNVL